MEPSADDIVRTAAILDQRDPLDICNRAHELLSLTMQSQRPADFFEAAKGLLLGAIFKPIATRDRISLWRLVRLPLEEPCDNVSRLDYPGAERITALGRLNDVGQQILYAAHDLPLVLLESRIEPGASFGVLEYQLREGEEFVTPHLGLTHLDYKEPPFLLGREGLVIIKQQFQLTASGAANLDLIHTYVCRFITEIDPLIYPITIALAKVVLDEVFPNADALLYPSIFRKNSLNVGIKPEAADRKLIRARAWRAIVTTPAGEFQHIACSSSIDERGAITWSEPSECNLLPGMPLRRAAKPP